MMDSNSGRRLNNHAGKIRYLQDDLCQFDSNNFNNHEQDFSPSIKPWLLMAPEFRVGAMGIWIGNNYREAGGGFDFHRRSGTS
jgi:hypothetical protein